jgi:hypothetical protein
MTIGPRSFNPVCACAVSASLTSTVRVSEYLTPVPDGRAGSGRRFGIVPVMPEYRHDLVSAGEGMAGEGMADEGMADEGLADEGLAGAVLAGAVLAGETPAVKILAGEVLAGEVLAGEVLAGEIPAGDSRAGEIPAGDSRAGEIPAGKVSPGEFLTDEVPAGEYSSAYRGRRNSGREVLASHQSRILSRYTIKVKSSAWLFRPIIVRRAAVIRVGIGI